MRHLGDICPDLARKASNLSTELNVWERRSILVGELDSYEKQRVTYHMNRVGEKIDAVWNQMESAVYGYGLHSGSSFFEAVMERHTV